MTAHTDLDAHAMSEPFIFIGTHTLREGKLEASRRPAASWWRWSRQTSRA
jgi:hypothetical protein